MLGNHSLCYCTSKIATLFKSPLNVELFQPFVQTSHLQMFRFYACRDHLCYFWDPLPLTAGLTCGYPTGETRKTHITLSLFKEKNPALHCKLSNSPQRLKRRSSTWVNRGIRKPGSSWLSGCRQWPARCQRASHACQWGPKHPAWSRRGQSASVSPPSLPVSALLKMDGWNYHLPSKWLNTSHPKGRMDFCVVTRLKHLDSF